MRYAIEPRTDLLEEALRHSSALRSWRHAALSLTQEAGVICFGELVRRCRIPIRGAILVLRSLVKQGLLQVSLDGFLLPATMTDAQRRPQSCSLCNEREAELSAESRTFLASFAEIASARPVECLLFGQRLIDDLGVLARTVALRHNGQLFGKRVALLGDDDLTSIGISLLGRPAKLTVLDIDERLLNFTAEVSRTLDLDIEVQRYDCADPVPSTQARSYDLVICDPYPTYDGSFESFFWSRAHTLLDPKGDSTVYSFVGPSHKPPAFTRTALKTIHQAGATVLEMRPGFNAYVVIDGELTATEDRASSGLNWAPKLSHTKDLVRFAWPGLDGGAAMERVPTAERNRGNIAAWIDEIGSHPLVRTLGSESQRQIALSATQGNPRWQSALRTSSEEGASDDDPRQHARADEVRVRLDGLVYELWGDSRLREWQASGHDADSLSLVTRPPGPGLTEEDRGFLLKLHTQGVRLTQLGEGRQDDLLALARLFESYHRQDVDRTDHDTL